MRKINNLEERFAKREIPEQRQQYKQKAEYIKLTPEQHSLIAPGELQNIRD